jgi:hypothetical protein
MCLHIDIDGFPIAKLGDFGSIAYCGVTVARNGNQAGAGHHGWMAPEVSRANFSAADLSLKMDIYAVGKLLQYLLIENLEQDNLQTIATMHCESIATLISEKTLFRIFFTSK